MKNFKTQKGITLVALIITIVVLLILAMAGIGAIRDSKIIAHAQNASDSYTIAQEKEQIGLAVSQWQLEKVMPGNTKLFLDVVDEAIEDETAEVRGEANGPLTVIFNKTGNQYMVEIDGTITPVIPEESNPNDPVNPEEPKDPEEVVTVGVKAYRFGEQICLITPQNDLIFVNPEEVIISSQDAYKKLTEDVSGYNITFTGFTPEEESKIRLLTGDGFNMGAIIAYIGDDRNIAYMGMITEGSTDVEISKSVYIEHSDELLAQYYQDDPNVEYYYGDWDTFSESNVTYYAGEFLYKIDYSNNIVTFYGNSDGTWGKIGEGVIDTKENNSIDINITIDGEPFTISTNALKIEYFFGGTNTNRKTNYIINGILFSGVGVNEGEELVSGYHTQYLTKYINTSALPQ